MLELDSIALLKILKTKEEKLNSNDATNIKSFSFLEELSKFMTPEEIANINTVDLTPETILEIFMETPGIIKATYLGDNTYKLNSTIAGTYEVKLSIVEDLKNFKQQ